MPRIANSGANVDAYHELTGNGDSTFDVCAQCWNSNHRSALNDWTDSDGTEMEYELYNGDPDGDHTVDIGDHPNYDEENGFYHSSEGDSDPSYTCACCDATLRSEDS